MNILFINDYITGGGVENVLYNIIEYLNSKKIYNITVLSLINQQEEFKRLYPENINYLSYELDCFKGQKFKKYSLSWVWKKGITLLHGKCLCSKRYDIVVAIKEGPSMLFAEKFKAKKKYAWIHVDYRYLHWTKSYFRNEEEEKMHMKYFDYVVCVSNAAKNSVVEVVGDSGNLLVKLNPMNVKMIIEKSNILNINLEEYMKKRKSNRKIFVSVGRLEEQKGYKRLLDVCSKLNEEYDYELWIVGGGNQKLELEEKILSLDLKNVILWGEQENPYPFIKKADWFISSSYGESYGLALQEALILNIPVIATTCPAFEECVSKEEAILVSNDNQSLFEGLYNILSENQLVEVYKSGINKNRTYNNFYIHRLEEIENLWKENQ